jgi:hypothetical protein
MSNVQLVIYDLSHGMARQLSAQFLGGPQYAIDVIPHTALVVYGREYYFGGGIQHQDPLQFRRVTGMHPMQTLVLGKTSVSRTEFELWCETATRSGRYTAASYDLLERNCNNFTHEAARDGLRLSQGIPEWILQVPQKFLSSPMGQIIRPILQNMQVTGDAGNASRFHTTARSNDGGNYAVTAPTDSFQNPWAGTSMVNEMVGAEAWQSTLVTSNIQVNTPTLDHFDKPLLSNDASVASICVKRLTASLECIDDQQVLLEVGESFAGTIKLTAAQVETAAYILFENFLPTEDDQCKDNATGLITFALMLFRLLALQAGDFSKQSFVSRCIAWVCEQLQAPRDRTHLSSTPSRTVAYLVLANVISLPDSYEMPSDLIETTLLTDWAISSQPRPEVRQAAAALAYNYILSAPPAMWGDVGEVSDPVVSLLCASVEGLATETDATTRLRRVLVAARTLRPVHGCKNEIILSLMRELGFVHSLENLNGGTMKSNDDMQCQLLVEELILMLKE